MEPVAIMVALMIEAHVGSRSGSVTHGFGASIQGVPLHVPTANEPSYPGADVTPTRAEPSAVHVTSEKERGSWMLVPLSGSRKTPSYAKARTSVRGFGRNE